MGAASATTTSAPISVEPQFLDRLVESLITSGREVVAPVVVDGVLTLAPIRSASEMPTGWTDQQDPGCYRAEETGGSARFRFAAPAQSWKRFLHEEETLLIRTRQAPSGIEVEPGIDDRPPLAFVGIRSCDLAAIGLLDVVLADDVSYQRRRADLVMIAVGCTRAAASCFCASVGTGPSPGPGADLILTELDDCSFVASAETAAGQELLESSGQGVAARSDQIEHADNLVAACAESQVRHLDPALVSEAAANPEADGWESVAERCLTCGNCTMVCPTCFCTEVDDRSSLTDDTAERWQRWESCFSLDFSYVHGGPIRESASSRYRQWYLHKLVTWHDQFGSSGCVGCGRCITWCPTGIDLTKAIVQ